MKTLNTPLILLFFCFPLLSLNAQSKAEKAIELYNRAEAIAEEEHMNFPAYYELAEQAMPLLKSTQQWEPYSWTLLGLMNTYYFDFQFHKSKEYANLFEKELKTIPVSDEFLLDKVLRISVYYANQANYPKAAEIMKWAVKIADRSGANKASIYNNLGYLNKVQGDYQVALDFYHKSIDERKQANPIRYGHLANTQRNLGRYYQTLKKYHEAEAYFLESLETLKYEISPDLIRNYSSSAYIDLGLNYQLLKDFNRAEFYLKKIEHVPDLLPRYHARAKLFLGKNYLKKKEIIQAQTTLKEAVFENRKINGLKHSNTAASYQFLGETFAANKQWEEALQNYQMALSGLVRNFNDTLDVFKNPDREGDIISKIDLLEVLSLKAEALNHFGEKKEAGNTFRLASDIIYDMRKDIFSYQSKLLLSDQSTELFEKAISFAFESYEETKDPIYLEQAFSFCEKNKSTLLLEAMLEAEAQGKSEIPIQIRNQLQSLKTELAMYDKVMRRAKDEKLSSLREKKIKIQEQIENINVQLSEAYPKYHRLRYALKTVDIKSVQKNLLGQDGVLIEFFAGKDHLYIFSISKENIDLKRLEQSTQLINLMAQYQYCFKDEHQIINQPDRFLKLSNDLFKTLLSSTLSAHAGKNKILIIPDGNLEYLPFDALVQELSPDNSARYLIEDYLLSMAYSASLLVQGESIKNNNKHLLAFAPLFENREFNLPDLPYSKVEINNIGGFDKTLLVGQQASVNAFRNRGPDYGFIHLSTHATLNAGEKNPCIYFIDSALYLNELFAMQLKANLVVLSACETNVGEHAGGEGVMSLARGFRHAGAKSLVASLWEVTDRSTSEIIQAFYQYLERGKSTPDALRLAKLDYLKRSDLKAYQKSPYRWASMVFIGQDGRVGKKANSSTYFLLFLAVGLILFGLFIKRKSA